MSLFGGAEASSPVDDFVEFERCIVRGHVGRVRTFLERGFRADSERFGSPLLLSAVVEGQIEVARLLLENGANPNVGNQQGWTSTHQAFRSRNAELVSMVIEHGALFGMKDVRGHSPLRIAVEADDASILSLLDGKDIDVRLEAADDDGVTPLQVATERRNIEMVKWLVARGASVHHRDEAGRTAADLAGEWIEGKAFLDAAAAEQVDVRQGMRELMAAAPSAAPLAPISSEQVDAPVVSVIRKRGMS